MEKREKEDFIACAKIHLANINRRGTSCAYFTRFYREDESVPTRCILDEILDDKNETYLNSAEAKKICPHRDARTSSKCNYNPEISQEDMEIEYWKLKEEVGILRKNIEELMKNREDSVNGNNLH